MYYILNRVNRPKWAGNVLILFRFFLHLELMISNELSEEIGKVDKNIQYIQNQSFLEDQPYSAGVFYIGTTIITLFILALLNDYLFFSYKYLYQTVAISRTIIGIVSSIYSYCLYIPLLYFSLDQLHAGNMVAIYNIPFLILIGLLITMHDQNYSINIKDSLAHRRSTKQTLLFLLIESSACIVMQYVNEPKFMMLVSFFLALTKSLEAFSKRNFENRSIRFLNMILSLYHLVISIVIYISLFAKSFMSTSIFILILAPLTFKVAHWIEYKQNNLNYWPINKQELMQNPLHLDFYLRLVLREIKLDFKDYCESDQSLFLEHFSTEHSVNCEQYPDCFCGREPNNIKEYVDMRISKELRSKYLIKYVRQLYFKCIRESLIKNKKVNTSICFSYLNFLIEIYQNKLLSFSEVIRLKRIVSYSPRENAILYQIFKKAQKTIAEKEASQSQANKKKSQQQRDIFQISQNENDQVIQKNKRYNEEINVIDYIVGIKFDEFVNKAEEDFYNTLQEKQNVLMMLFNDHIDLELLREKARNLVEMKVSLQKELVGLYKMNQNSQKLLFYTDSFANYLGFGQKRRQIFVKNKSFSYSNLKTDINVFNQNTCVIFITLINDVGSIRKIQNKFENIFGFPNNKALKANINLIIPSGMQKAHDESLKDYLKNPENSTRNNFKLLIAQNDQGWAIPVSIKFRPDNINLEDCGLTAFFEKPSNEYHYVQLTCGYFQIQSMTQSLYQKIFSALYSQSDTYRIYFNRVIPLLNYFEKQQVKQIDLNFIDQTVQTVAFLPKLEILQKGYKRFYLSERLDIADLEQQVKMYTVEFYDIYTVKLKFYYNKFKRLQFNILEIHTFKKVTGYDQQKECLVNFKNQLKTLLDINIDIKKDIEIIDYFIELQTLENLQADCNFTYSSFHYLKQNFPINNISIQNIYFFFQNFYHLPEIEFYKIVFEITSFLVFIQFQRIIAVFINIQIRINFFIQKQNFIFIFNIYIIIYILTEINSEISEEEYNNADGYEQDDKHDMYQLQEINEDEFYQEESRKQDYNGQFNNDNIQEKIDHQNDQIVQEIYGNSQVQLNKYNELSEIVENRQLNEISQVHQLEKQSDFLNDNMRSFDYGQNRGMYAPVVLSPVQNGAYTPTTILSPNIVKSDDNLFSQNQLQEIYQSPRITAKRQSISNQVQTGRNKQNSNSNAQIIHDLIKQSSMNGSLTRNKSNSTNSKIQQLKQKNLEHQASVTSILNQYYDLKQKEIGDEVIDHNQDEFVGRNANKKTSLYLSGQKPEKNQQNNSVSIIQTTLEKDISKVEEEEEDEVDKTTYDEKSQKQKNSQTSTKNTNQTNNNNDDNKFNLCQLLKQRIKITKQQVEMYATIRQTKMQQRGTVFVKNQSQQRLSLMLQQLGEGNQDSPNYTQKQNKINQALPLERYYTTTKLERQKTKNQTNMSKSQISRQQVLKADDLTSEQFSDSVAREEELQNQIEMQRSRLLAASSVNTNQSQNQEQKKSVYKMVTSDKKNYSLLLLFVFGILAMFAFSSLILYQFFQIKTSFNKALVNFNLLPWPMSVRFQYSKVFSDTLFRRLVEKNFIPSFTAQKDVNYTKVVDDRIKFFAEQYKGAVIDYVYSDIREQNYFEYSIFSKMDYVVSKDILVIENKYKNITSQKAIIKQSPCQFIISLMPYVYTAATAATEVSKFYSEVILLDNFGQFYTNIVYLQSLISQSVLDIINSIKQQALVIMIIIISATFILAFTTIPLYHHIQTKNEELLKLFSTISGQALNEMIQPIQISIMSHKTQTKIKYFQLPIYKKRKTISSTTAITKIKAIYFLYILIGVIMMIVQPIVSYIYIERFYNETVILTDLIQSLYNTKAFCSSAQAINYGLILSKSGKYKLYNPEYYDARVVAINKARQDTLQDFYNVIDQSQKTTRYQENEYQNFFYKVISEDICENINNHPEFVKDVNKFDISRCKTIKGGMLTKGLQISLKDLLETFASFQQFFEYQTPQQFLDNFLKYEEALNLKEFDEVFDIITITIEILKDFLIGRVSNFISEMQDIFYSLLIYQLTMMLLIFYFGFFNFYSYVDKEMIQIKRLISILSIECVLDNPYILSYLNKHE